MQWGSCWRRPAPRCMFANPGPMFVNFNSSRFVWDQMSAVWTRWFKQERGQGFALCEAGGDNARNGECSEHVESRVDLHEQPRSTLLPRMPLLPREPHVAVTIISHKQDGMQGERCRPQRQKRLVSSALSHHHRRQSSPCCGGSGVQKCASSAHM